MKIGMMLPSTYSVGSPYNGVREQAYFQASALELLGHEVMRLNPWQKSDLDDFEIIQFFQGGPAMNAIETTAINRQYKLVFAPIIDADMPDWKYRVATEIGRIHPKLKSIQAYYAEQAKGSDAVVARSSHERSKLVHGLGVNQDNVHLVLNGCPDAGLASSDRARKKIGIHDDFIFHLSKYSNRNKNVANMIKAIAPTKRQLVIAGTCEENEHYREIIALAAEHETVHLIGRIDDQTRNDLYAACRVFCLPSYREGTGLVAVEAAAHGAAVVITANGGPPDYFKDYVDYVHGQSPDEIRSAVELAWNRSRKEREAMKSHANDNLTWSSSASQLVKLYETL